MQQCMFCGAPAHSGVIVHNQGCPRPMAPTPDVEHDKEVIDLLKRIVASLDALVERGNT